MESQIIDHVRNWCNHVGKGATKSEWSEGKNMSTWADYFTFDVLSDLAFGKPLDVYDKEDNRFVIELLPTAVKSLYEVCNSGPGIQKLLLTVASQLGYHPWSSFLRKLMFQTPLGDLAGGIMVRDHKRFTSFADGALAQRLDAKNDTEKAGAAPGRKDIFYHLVKAKDPETGEGYTRGELEAESRLLLVAGSDTSSTTLAACCFYLVRNRRILDKLTEEIRSAFADVEDIRYAGTNLPNLTYLRACIDETLRICAPTPAHTPREVGPGGATIDGMFFPAGTVVGVSLYALHHNEDYYPDPFTFSPERWIVDPKNDVSAEGVARAQSAFGAFGLGPRGCVGKNLAYVELSLTLARLLWLYDIRAKEGDHTGEGGPGKTLGRARVGEYQLEDIWVSRRNGPVIELRAR